MQYENTQNDKGSYLEKYYFRIYSKVNQANYLLLPIYSSNFKAQALSFWDSLLTRIHPYFLKGHISGKGYNPQQKEICIKLPKMTKSHTQEILFRIYSKVNQVIYSSLSIYSLNFKALASIAFKILCWHDFFHMFSKGHNSGKGHNPKKNIHVSYLFHEKSKYEISKA